MEDEALFEQAVALVRANKICSPSFLQRRLRIGYGRASFILDQMETQGIITPATGAAPRQVIDQKKRKRTLTLFD